MSFLLLLFFFFNSLFAYVSISSSLLFTYFFCASNLHRRNSQKILCKDLYSNYLSWERIQFYLNMFFLIFQFMTSILTLSGWMVKTHNFRRHTQADKTCHFCCYNNISFFFNIFYKQIYFFLFYSSFYSENKYVIDFFYHFCISFLKPKIKI